MASQLSQYSSMTASHPGCSRFGSGNDVVLDVAPQPGNAFSHGTVLVPQIGEELFRREVGPAVQDDDELQHVCLKEIISRGKAGTTTSPRPSDQFIVELLAGSPVWKGFADELVKCLGQHRATRLPEILRPLDGP